MSTETKETTEARPKRPLVWGRGGRPMKPDGVQARMLQIPHGESKVFPLSEYLAAKRAAQHLRDRRDLHFLVRIEGSGRHKSTRRLVVYRGVELAARVRNICTDRNGVRKVIPLTRARGRETSGITGPAGDQMLDSKTIWYVNRGFRLFCERRGLDPRHV